MVVYSIYITLPLAELVNRLKSIGLVADAHDKQIDETINATVEWLLMTDANQRDAFIENHRQWLYQTQLTPEECRVYFESFQLFLLCVAGGFDQARHFDTNRLGSLHYNLQKGSKLNNWDLHYIPVAERHVILTITLTDPVYSDYANLI